MQIIKSIDIFNDEDKYLNNLRLFQAYFDKVPNIKCITNVDCTRLRKWMDVNMLGSIINKHTSEVYDRRKKKMMFKHSSYIMKNDLLLTLQPDLAEVVYAGENEHLAQELLNKLKQFLKRKKYTTDINLVVPGYHYNTKPVKLKKPNLNISTHYNDDLEELHFKILANLKKKNTKGLYLFYGAPGTGKSTYIRYLIHHLKKKVIFISPALAGDLNSPQFSAFLTENMNSVIIIEDAEELIVSRDRKPNSSISTLLNLSDGLLAESLGIQIIASFNTNITNVDKALLRKGRLTALYEFKELSLLKSASLIASIGFQHCEVTKSMTLAEIYNIEETSYQLKPQRNAIGFMANNN